MLLRMPLSGMRVSARPRVAFLDEVKKSLDLTIENSLFIPNYWNEE